MGAMDQARRATRSNTPARRGGEGGFTISELVLVLVVVSVLMTIAVVSLRGIGDESSERECQSELRAIKAASEQFYAMLNFYPPNDQALKDANLLALDETPNWRVVTPEGATKPRYEPEGSRCQ